MLDKNSKLRFVISNFNELETQLSQCLSYIPFVDQNKQVISPKFIPILLETCGLIESIFKELEGDSRKRYDLRDYSKLIEPVLVIEQTISLFLNPPLQFLNPFAEWTKKPPLWWQAYNNIKHDRLNNYDSATYENVVMAMAGLHQVISRDTSFIPALLAAGWYNSNSDDVSELVVARIAQAGLPMQTIPVESKFFVSPIHMNFVSIKDNRPVIEGCEFTSRVQDMLMAYEWL